MSNPEMAKYHHNLAAIKGAHGDLDLANTHYKQALRNDNQNLMIRNDLALNLAHQGHLDASTEEFKRALLIKKDQPTLHKNISAVYARDGHFREAHEHARRAVQINPNDAMSLRNLAKLKDAIGDSRSALPYYIKSIEVEQKQNPNHLNTNAFRSAAVQMIVQGGSNPNGVNSGSEEARNEALRLISAARAIDGVHYQSPTTEKTNEILRSIRARRGDVLEKLARDAKRRKDALAMKEQIMKSGAENFGPKV